MTTLEMRYADERQREINDANRHNPTTTIQTDTMSEMNAFFAQLKAKEENKKATPKKVYNNHVLNGGHDDARHEYFIYDKTYRINIVGEKVEL